MLSRNFRVVNAQGFHMRPASVFAAEMSGFSSDVFIKHGDVNVNGKSVMALIAACLKFGTEFELTVSGEDEEAAMEKAAEMIESGFGEE